LLNLLRATKANNLSLHVASPQKMTIITLAATQQSTGRPCSTFQLNIPTTHRGAETLLQEKGVHCEQASVPGSRYAEDITTEQMINKYNKSQG
jgi:hypothetical protein